MKKSEKVIFFYHKNIKNIVNCFHLRETIFCV